MRLYLIGCVIISTGCSQIEAPTLVAPVVDQELRTVCDVPTRNRDTLKDVAIILTDHVQALDCANGKIVAINDILTRFEERISTMGDPVQDAPPCYIAGIGQEILIGKLGAELVDQHPIEIETGVAMIELWDMPDGDFLLTVRDDFQICIAGGGPNRMNRMIIDFIQTRV